MSIQYTRVVVDENVPKEVVDCLINLGAKEVYWIAEKKAGITDPEVWRIATEKEAVLITRDKGFLQQLKENQILYGPILIEYWTDGFSKDELRDNGLMAYMIEWLIRKAEVLKREHLKLSIKGVVSTRRQLWGQEKVRRKKAGLI